jgi:excisionase family DNA binding protein
MPRPNDSPHVLTVEEAAAFLGIGRNAAYEAVARGEIPAIRIGRSIRIPRSGLMHLLKIDEALPSQAPAIQNGESA